MSCLGPAEQDPYRVVLDAYDRSRSSGNEARREARKLLTPGASNDTIAALLLAPRPPANLVDMTMDARMEWALAYDAWYLEVCQVAIERARHREFAEIVVGHAVQP